jgi:YHS domain-containing protein
MRRSLLVLIVLLACGGRALGETPKPVLALKGLDPIALAEGKEVAGKESIGATYGLFEYHFASVENRKEFLKDPEGHGVQFGGACGKMGPFSGMGSPERYFVHASKIYLFASEGCRDGFKGAPEQHIEVANPVPTGTALEKQKGAELIELALRGFGGNEKVDGLMSLEIHEVSVYVANGKETAYPHRLKFRFPMEVLVEDDFGSIYGYVVSGDKASQFAKSEMWPLESLVRDVARRQVLRYPILMLKNRDHRDFVAFVRADGVVGEVPVKRLEVFLHGATSTWSIDPATGRVLEVAYVARQARNGDNVERYSDFRAVDGLMLPHVRTRFFNGKELKSPVIRHEKYVVNGQVDDLRFADAAKLELKGIVK